MNITSPEAEIKDSAAEALERWSAGVGLNIIEMKTKNYIVSYGKKTPKIIEIY